MTERVPSLTTQYYSKSELFNLIPPIKIANDDIISSDSYNEEELAKSFNHFDKETQILLTRCAIQISIIGSGNKTYGFIRDNQNNVQEISKIFDKYKINYNKKINEKYEPGQLTARRLVRLLRYQIQLFIEANNRYSYLWAKYSTKDKTKINVCFPGAEHLIETKEDGLYLFNTYKNVDLRLGTKFVDRLKRTYIARGLFMPLELIDL